MKDHVRSVPVIRRFFLAVLFLPVLAAFAFAQPGQVKKLHDLDDAKVPPEAALRGMAVAAAATGDYRIDALLSGYQWSTSSLTYSFYEDDVYHGAYYGTETGVREVSEAVKANVRQILAWYSTLMNMNFTEVSETSGQIGTLRFMLSNGPSYAWAYYPGSTSGTSVAGDVHLNSSYDRLGDTNGFQHPAGQHGYVSIIHEIGHTLGLKHPFDGSPNLPTAEDNQAHTVMTYTFTGNSPGTPMGYDLMALQYLYAARPNRTGNGTYLFTSRGTDQYDLAGTLYLNTGYHTQQTIWDSAGFNNLDGTSLPQESAGYLLDLRELGWLVANRLNAGNYFTYGSVVANGTAIYDITNSSSSDTIYANSQPNVFKGYSKSRATGNDVIYNAGSEDTLDLSGYVPSDVTQSRSGEDHVIGLGSNGSVTLKGYYLGPIPAISFSPSIPSFSITDASVTEGNAGATAANFTVTLSSVSSDTLTVQYSTADGTALLSDGDYVFTSGTLTFAPNETVKTISVPVVGDTKIETNESFFVNLSGATVPISDPQGVGTIVNDDVNAPPTAVASATPTSGVEPLAVQFNGSASRDSDGTIASYAWNFGDGQTANGVSPLHTYAKFGTYTAVLTVTDNRGATGAASVVVTVTAPPIQITAMAPNGTQYFRSLTPTVSITATVTTAASVPVSGATVTFTMTKPGKKPTTTKVTATTNSVGVATWSYKIGKRDATGTYRITSTATYGSNSASSGSLTASFVVQ